MNVGSTKCPYIGLRPFGEADRDLFFGRRKHIYELFQLAVEKRITTIVGCPGSGKSSLVHAGLVPELRSERKGWCVVNLHPSNRPVEQLTAGLVELMLALDRSAGNVSPSALVDWVGTMLRRSTFGLRDLIAARPALAGRPVLVIVDELDELFRYRRAGWEDEAAAFVQLLLAASVALKPYIAIVFTVRSDFLDDCSRFPGLIEAINRGLYLVPPLDPVQLRAAIIEPLQRTCDDMEPALLQLLLTEETGEADKLAVLQHALMRCWHRAPIQGQETSSAEPQNSSGRRILRLSDYVELGELRNALSSHGDEIAAELVSEDAEHELAIKQTFCSLAELDGGRRAIRRSLSYRRLVAETDLSHEQLKPVVCRFLAADAAFLAMPGSDALTDDSLINITHDVILWRWHRLRVWLASGTADRH